MKAKIVAAITLIGVATTACDSIGQAMTAHTDVLARAAGHELKVDRAASLINTNPRIPAQPDVVNAVANLWVDYMLLATAASKDSTLRNVNLDYLLKPVLDQDAVVQLRDKEVKFDTTFTDAELQQEFERTGTGLQVKARHILLRLPADATPAARDSVMKLAQSLRDQARAGGDFAELARKHSADGSAAQGGDLGFFGKGQMVAPFEEAAFKTPVGQVSDVVESPFGLHVIKVEERKNSSFADFRDSFRMQMVQERVAKAEENYVKGLTDPLNIEIQPGAYEIVKEYAAKPETNVRGRTASRALVKYKGGEFTTGDYVDFLRTRMNAQNRAGIPQQPDENLKNMLESLTRSKILVEEAGRKKLNMPAVRLDSMKTQAYQQLVEAARAAGLLNIQPQEGESKDAAIERRVLQLMEATIKGETNVIPLGPLSYSLREQFKGEIFERSVPAVVAKIEATRPPQQTPPPGQLAPTPPPTGTTGN